MALKLNLPSLFRIKLAIPSLEKLMYFRNTFWKKVETCKRPQNMSGVAKPQGGKEL